MRFIYLFCFIFFQISGTTSEYQSLSQKCSDFCSNHLGLITSIASIGVLYIANKLFNQPLKANLELNNLNIITFDPGELFDTDYFERVGLNNNCENGIRTILQKLKSKQVINTHIRVSNVKLEKERIVHVFSGVPQHKSIIFIYSGGWLVGPCGQTGRSDGFVKDNKIIASCGVGAHLVNRYMRFGILNGTTVTFDYPTDERRTFNCAQEDDIVCLKKVYDVVAMQNPNAQIVLVGDCKGATTILNLITHPRYYNQLGQVKGILVESPPASVRHVAYNIADRWLSALPGSRNLIYSLFKLAMPAYNDSIHIHTILNAQKEHIPLDLPIFIGRIAHDDIASDMIIEQMVDKLKANGNQKIYLYTCQEKIRHARLGKVVGFQQAANAFFKKFGFEYQ